MKTTLHRLAALLAVTLASLAAAHDGEMHAQAPPPLSSDSSLRPQWRDDGTLLVPKAVQRQLGIRTVRASQSAETTQTLLAEVVAAPGSRGGLKSPQAGRLEAAAKWPLPGQTVVAGEVIAWLRPLLAQRDAAQRRAQLADVEQKLQVSRINAERLRVQAEASGGVVTNENVYREQAELELETMQKRQQLETSALQDRMAIRAPLSGTLVAVPVRDGEVVSAGQPLFEIADPRGLWISVLSAEPGLAAQLRSAQLQIENAAPVPLQLRSEEPATAQIGWRLLFEMQAAPSRSLQPGELLKVQVQRNRDRAELQSAAYCVADAQGVSVWIHDAPERFRKRHYQHCADVVAQRDDERWVTQGAALLSQYR